jgi:ribosomal protein S18 acetylase RimI-like enzyme
MVKIERKNSEHECVSFLKKAGVCNMYMLEGIGVHHSHVHNYCLYAGDEIVGVLHTKNSVYLHLYLVPEADHLVVRELATLIGKSFPKAKMLFGDARSVSLYFSGRGTRPVKTVRFIFMEIDYDRFKPRSRYRGDIPSAGDVALLLPLQIQYEIEEVGAIRTQIDRKKVLKVMERKIQRGEISAIFDAETPVAIAGVNARFENSCQIGSVYVLPRYRGRGYGYSVVSYHTARLFKRYERIVLFVHEKNKAALHIYGNLGFEPTHVLVQAYC